MFGRSTMIVCVFVNLTPNPSRPSKDRYSPLLQRLQRQQPTDRDGNIGLTVDPINEGDSRGKLRIYHVCASEIRIRAEFRNSVLRTHVQYCLPTLGSFFFLFWLDRFQSLFWKTKCCIKYTSMTLSFPTSTRISQLISIVPPTHIQS